MSDFTDVGKFHAKFGLPVVCEHKPGSMMVCDNMPGPREVPRDVAEFRIKFLEEELQEFKDALAAGDLAKAFDALIDLNYVSLGTAHLFGFPWQAGWDMVQDANMRKVRATGADDPLSKRQHAFDVVKPPGWLAPDIGQLLDGYGFPGPKVCPGCNRVLSEVECYIVTTDLRADGRLVEVNEVGYYCERRPWPQSSHPALRARLGQEVSLAAASLRFSARFG